MSSEEVDYIPAQEIPRGGKLSRVIPEAPFTQTDDVFAESNQLTGAGDDHSVLINLGPSSRSSTFNDKEEIISPSSDVVESDNPVEDFSQPTPTSSWRSQFTSDPQSFDTVLEAKVESPKSVSTTHNSGWFHSTIDEPGSTDGDDSEDDNSEPSVVEHKCAPRLSIPYNPIPQESGLKYISHT